MRESDISTLFYYRVVVNTTKLPPPQLLVMVPPVSIETTAVPPPPGSRARAIVKSISLDISPRVPCCLSIAVHAILYPVSVSLVEGTDPGDIPRWVEIRSLQSPQTPRLLPFSRVSDSGLSSYDELRRFSCGRRRVLTSWLLLLLSCSESYFSWGGGGGTNGRF